MTKSNEKTGLVNEPVEGELIRPDNSVINSDTKELISAGSDMFGGAAGAAIGFVVAGPVGVLAGGVGAPLVSRAINNMATELIARTLGKREEARTGVVMSVLLSEIQQRMKKGEKLRDDGFFTHKVDDRSSADEVLEGVMLSSQREFEEKKLKYFGKLYASIAFSKDIEKDHANLLVKTARDLSYRQLCLLRVFALNGKANFNLRDKDYNGSAAIDPLVAILQEIIQLDSLGMVNCSGNVLLGVSNIIPAKMVISGTGVTLHYLMELWEIPLEDLEGSIKLLK